MKVIYKVYTSTYNSITGEMDVKVSTAKGEIVGVLPGNALNPDRFIVCDDDTSKFVKVNINDCIKE